MRALAPLALVPLLAFVPQDSPETESTPDAPETVAPVREDFRATVAFDGSFVPADFEELSIWPETYSGGLLFLEVVPHGTFVNPGDVIARFDMEPIEKAIQDAERALHSAEIGHEGVVTRAELSEEEAQERLKDAVLALERAERDLEGWEKFELPFKHRGDEMRRQRLQNQVDDQAEELKQLEAMYSDDELVDAVEEIVLSRSRRDLATARASMQLSLEQMKYTVDFDLVETGKRKLRTVETQRKALDRLARRQELDRKGRQDGIVQSEVGLVRKRERLEELRGDHERMILRAPRSGVVLHGGVRDYLPGARHAEYRRGSHGSFRTGLFCVATPDRLDVAIQVGEDQLGEVRNGMSSTVHSLFDEEKVHAGTLALDRYPTANSSGGPVGKFAGHVTLTAPVREAVAGMRAKVEVVVETIPGALLLPNAAVHDADGDPHCFVLVVDDHPRRVALTLGPVDGDRIVVQGDLTEKDLVLLPDAEQ